MPPQVDLVLVFRSSPGKVLTKPQARENARQAAQQYTRLLEVLKSGRLHAVGKRGEKEGQLLVLVHCPESTLTRLVQRERCVRAALSLPASADTNHSQEMSRYGVSCTNGLEYGAAIGDVVQWSDRRHEGHRMILHSVCPAAQHCC